SDNCSFGISANPASGSVFAVGTTTVTATATDASGNTATCNFTVTVNDNKAPVALCPGNITQGTDAGVCSAIVSFTVPAPEDECSAVSVAAPASGSLFNVGVNTV
ncbi:MAG TPA: HYR domain-containing protein, partial [Chitinophagales bacterium]|nr:HYR domain-containing protein [Chitinophagales bacterium]HRK29332.1 HYR domain-containing protein [Chitinophagales bacterium]